MGVAQAIICRGQSPGYAVEYPYRPAPSRLSGEDETYQRHPACRIRDLCPADQLSDSAARHRAASLHAGSDPQSRDDEGPHECADCNLAATGNVIGRLTPESNFLPTTSRHASNSEARRLGKEWVSPVRT